MKHSSPGSRQAASAMASPPAWARAAAMEREPCEYGYRLDGTGRQHFNFRQRLWLQPRVAMAMTPVITIALETLAANLLSLALSGTGDGSCDRLALKLARRFCEQCLLTADPDGWLIPCASIRAWVAAQRRRGLLL